uniref:DUF1985 domain-containing protein n=1 Tax=Lactuca sativa TaxID=4236 RepID=A0A9R1WUT8_LACSA|nr:hypothetical protein LSAT_V11C900501480 [Lactuca sativa]
MLVSNMLLIFVQHDYNNFNDKAIVNLKGSGYGIWFLIGRPSFTRGRIVVPQDVSSSDMTGRCFISIWDKRLYFRVGGMKMVYGPEEFCLITGLNFGEYPKNIRKKVCLLRERLFPNYTNSSVKIGDLESFILNQPFLEVADADVVRVCLIYILCECFLGKEINDRDLEDTWNKINKDLSLPELRQTLKYSVSRFTAPFTMLPAVRACGFVLRKNREMSLVKR